jgi:uncharacterized membrane protein YeaQ/YmgE (transglycosylase-associated protein family)
VQDINLGELYRVWTQELYVWTGFGTLVGLIARTLMPGKDRAGVFTTILVGVAGAVIGSALLAYFWEGYRVTPLSPVGLVVAVAGAFILLLFHRLLGGYAFPGKALLKTTKGPHVVHRHEKVLEGE